MRSYLKLISAVVLFWPCLAFAIDVTFLNPGKKGERFWDMVTETMQAAAADFDIRLEVIYAERNRINMVNLGQQVAARPSPPNYLILVNEEQAALKIFQATKGKPIKTLMLLNDFLPKQRSIVGFPGPDNANLLGALTPDNFSAGKRMMHSLFQCVTEKQTRDPYHFLAIGGDQLTPASIDRNNGALEVVKQNKQIALDRFLYANWSQTEAKQLTENYLKWASRNNIFPAAIWAANDPIAFGAKAALTAANLKAGEDVCLVGLNWSSEALRLVEKGEMVMTDGGHFLAGAWSMVALNDYHQRALKGDKQVLGTINFQMQSIDHANVGQYLQHLGDENWGKINFAGFSLQDQQNYSDYDFSLQRVFQQIQP